MIRRRLLSNCCFILLLVPTVGWALNESGDLPAAQSASGEPAPVQPAPEQTVPANPVHDPVPVPVPASSAQPAPAQSLSKKPAPAKSAPLQSVPTPPAHESPADATTETIDIEVFVREDCLQCDKAKEFLAKLRSLQPQLKIIIRDVRKEPAALVLLKRMAQNQGDAALDYPAFVVGGQLILGFSEDASTAQLILDTLAISHPTSKGTQNCETGKEPGCGLIEPAPEKKPEIATVKLFGYSVPVVQIGLPLFTVAMGLLDGLNHGSTWVLLLMISLLSPMKNRPFMFVISGTFIAVQGITYFILMAAWFRLFLLLDISRISQFAIAAIALLAGAIYFKKYMHLGKIISLSSNEIAKPGIYSQIRKIVQTENIAAAMLGTAVLAVLVQLGEFSYTSVFPALYTHVLTLQHLDSLSNYGYLLLYDLAYMLDDVIVLAMGIFTLSQTRPQEQNGRVLKLVSGLVLVGLGMYLLLIRH